MEIKAGSTVTYYLSFIDDGRDIMNGKMICSYCHDLSDYYVIGNEFTKLYIPKTDFKYNEYDDCYEGIDNRIFYYLKIDS